MSADIQTERPVSGRAIESRLEIVNPLERPNWDTLVAAHPRSTVFHGSGWARVLAETYGHVPVYVCRFDEGRLVEALPLMEVSSWWKGRRGVSLPFTDFAGSLRTECRWAQSLPGGGQLWSSETRSIVLNIKSTIEAGDEQSRRGILWARY